MAGGLAALLDDIAALAKLAAASVDDVSAAAGRASAKAAGVVIDDTAVTPRYVHGFTADRELPIIKRIALGSLRNKLLFILPAAILLSQFVPWLLTPILMVGGTYLAFEGAEKLYELLAHRTGAHTPPAETEAGAGSALEPGAGPGTATVVLEDRPTHEAHAADGTPVDLPAAAQGADVEKSMVAGAIRTDFILSAEIMVIALNEVAQEPLVSRAIILAVVAVLITALVYGVVALIVKMDDVGLHLVETRTGGLARAGELLVRAMPTVLSVLSTVGIVAMLWVGGHILLVGVDELGWHAPVELVHGLEEALYGVVGVGGVLAWSAGTLASALVGLLVGAVVVLVAHLIPRRSRSRH
jgi:predicted DNA repair protein MutK